MSKKEKLSSEESSPGGRRQMAQFTLERLLQRKKEAKDELQRLGRGANGHQRASLHDAPAVEERRNALRSLLHNIGNLDGVEVIQPRQDTSKIGLGNRVTVEFPSGEETFIILGDNDVKYSGRSDIISHKSPVGSALLGKQKEETVVCRLPGQREIRIKVKDIKPGDF